MQRFLHTTFWLTVLLFAWGNAHARELADAAQRGDYGAVQGLLHQGVDVNMTQPDGATALHWAAHREDTALVEALISAGAEVDRANRAGITPMALAAETGNPRIVERLLQAGVDPNERLRNGETPLMMAARTGVPEAVEVLLQAGAEIEAREDLRGTTALMWAISYGNAATAQLLINAGADIGAHSGEAPRGRNTRISGAARDRIRSHLLGVGEFQGRTPIRQGVGEVPEESVPEEFDDADANAGGLPPEAEQAGGSAVPVDSQGRPVDLRRAPHLAVLITQWDEGEAPPPDIVSSAEIVAQIRAQVENLPEDAEQPPGGGITPLVFAARIGDIEAARMLLEAGADINQTTFFHVSPLLAAIQNRYYQMAHFLLDHGADPNIDNHGGWNPLYLAVNNRNIEGGDYPTRRPDADDMELIVRLLELGADANARMRSSRETRTVFTNQWLHEDGATPFLRAAQSGDLEVLHLLLEYGADPSIPTYRGVSPLMVAAGIGWVEGISSEHSPEETLETIKLLLELGADVNHQDWVDHRSALMGAAHKGRPEVLQVLLDHGADPGLYDIGSRDTMYRLGGVVWQAVDYADGLVRIGVQSAVAHPESGELLRNVMLERGMQPPASGRTLESICVPSVDGRRLC